MAPINTRSHIVLDKESLERYAGSLGAEYTAIFEMDLKDDIYGTLFCTEEQCLIAHSGRREEILESAGTQVHAEDREQFLSIFESENLWRIIRQDGYESAEFRCLTSETEYRWMRILITPDEIEKNTILCFITDINDKKRCEFLEKRNAELTALVTRLYGSLSETGRTRDSILNITEYKGQLAEAAR